MIASCPPVLFLIFNRPDLTRQVFARIRDAKPSQFFIAADGPRSEHLGEVDLCAQTRAIIDQVDWTCEIYTLFRDENLGCKMAVSGAINWFFEHVEQGIILEDDCLPHPSFFLFCAELLEKYRNDPRVGMISGDKFLPKNISPEASYYFSNSYHCWGWATWSRAWKLYDISIAEWPNLKKSRWLANKVFNENDVNNWSKNFDGVYRNEIDTWDYQWFFALWYHNLLSITPKYNLISNIGFGNKATHTKVGNHSNIPIRAIDFPLTHPKDISQDVRFDEHENIYFASRHKKNIPSQFLNYGKRILRKISHLFSKKERIKRAELKRLKKLTRFVPVITDLLDHTTSIVDAKLFLLGKEEILDRKIYEFRSSNPIPLIIDCGANIGLSVIYFKSLYPNARVMAFEPDPNIYKHLMYNVKSFNLMDVELHNQAVWTQNGTIDFFPEGGFSGRIPLPGDTQLINVSCVRLRDFLEIPVDFLKIDIEGAETDVIIDCGDSLKNVTTLFVEYHSHVSKPQNLGELLQSFQMLDSGITLKKLLAPQNHL